MPQLPLELLEQVDQVEVEMEQKIIQQLKLGQLIQAVVAEEVVVMQVLVQAVQKVVQAVQV